MLTLIKRDINSNGRISTYMPACVHTARPARVFIYLTKASNYTRVSLAESTERNYLLRASACLTGGAQLFHFRASLSLLSTSFSLSLSLHLLVSLAVKSASRTSRPINANNQRVDSLRRVSRLESSLIRAITRSKPVSRLQKTARAPESLCINDNARIHTKILVRV